MTGIIGLLPAFNTENLNKPLGHISLSLIYYGLLGIMLISISKMFTIYRENHEITFKGKLGKIMKIYISDNLGTMDKYGLLNWYSEAAFMISTAFLFELLFFINIGWL